MLGPTAAALTFRGVQTAARSWIEAAGARASMPRPSLPRQRRSSPPNAMRRNGAARGRGGDGRRRDGGDDPTRRNHGGGREAREANDGGEAATTRSARPRSLANPRKELATVRSTSGARPGQYDAAADGRPTIHRLPECMQRLECLTCAGFVKRSGADGRGALRGTSYPSVVGWDELDIRSFYTRVGEAFSYEYSRHVQHLLEYSLCLTLAHKRKVRSRRKVYKLYGKDLGGYPVPNEERPQRFRSDRPVPLAGRFECTNQSREACWRRIKARKEGPAEKKVTKNEEVPRPKKK